jgi:hypothetical protein
MLLSLVTVKPRNDERVVKPRHTTESSRPQRRHSLAPPQATGEQNPKAHVLLCRLFLISSLVFFFEVLIV